MWDLRWLWGTLLYKMNCCNSPDSVQYVQVHQQPAGSRKHMVTTNLKSEYLHRLTSLVNSKGNSPCQTFMPNAISRATRLEAKSSVSWNYRKSSCYMQEIWPGKVFKLCKHSTSEKLLHSLKHSFARPLSPCSASVPCTTTEAAVLWGVMLVLQASSSLTLPPFEFSAVLWVNEESRPWDTVGLSW